MRGTRWLLLVAIAAILGGVGLMYRAQKRAIQAQATAKPQPLPNDLRSSSLHPHFSQTNPNSRCRTYDIDADDGKQLSDGSRVDLTNVQLKVYSKACDSYDLVKSAAAAFFPNEHRFYSEGEVEITLKIPLAGQPAHQRVSIRASGVTVDTDTYRLETDRAASFTFEHGDGSATGASYDPTTRELEMKHDAVMHWEPPRSDAKPMTIEAGSLVYREGSYEVLLRPWGKLTRGQTVVEGDNVVVRLRQTDDDEPKTVLKQVQAEHAHGTDDYPNRKLQYAADQMLVDCDPDGEVQKITGDRNARLVSTSAGAETTVTAGHVELNFDVKDEDSILTRVDTAGQSVVTQKPLAVPGRQPPETDVLRSEQIELRMRPDGREIEGMVTPGPGTLEFLPNLPDQHHRTLEGNDIAIAYGPRSRVQNFRATHVKTHTDPTAEERKRNRTVATTASRDLVARFDPQTSRMASMEQSGDFTYEEGDRKARASRAKLDSADNTIVLESGARVWDATGWTVADHIRLDERSGDFTAEGNVNSSRLPDQDSKKGSQMLSGSEPLQAQARRMESRRTDASGRSRTLHYEGNVLMWQGANRIQADTIDHDRDKRTLVADGHVITSLWEQPKDNSQKKKPGPAVLTVVHAGHLMYTEADRLAVYSGGATMERPGMRVKCRELRAYLADSGADSRLEKAMADGAVEIVHTEPDRVRTGTGDHGEFYTQKQDQKQKVILRGARAKLVDTFNGKTDTSEGSELTYYPNDGSLLVNGSPNQPVETQIVRKRK